MRKSLRIAGFTLALFLSYESVKAQVKIGGDPATVNANAILELESNRKGLLLPRLDAAGFTILKNRNATPGMVVYLLNGADPRGEGFYVKTAVGTTDANWTKMAGDAGGNGPWKINGNDGLASTDWFGTIGNVPLSLRANSNPVMQFSEVNGNITIPYANVPVAAVGVNDVVMIGADGLIQKKNLSLTSVTALNSLKGDVTLTVTPDNTALVASLVAPPTAPAGTLDVKLPIMAGAVGQQYGFMTIADWNKLQTITSATGITIGDVVTGAVGGAKGAYIERLTGADEGKLVLHLVEASDSHAGIVTIGNQSFSGNKTFTNNLSVTGNTAIGGDATVAGDATITGNTTVTGTSTLKGNATVEAALSFANPVPYSTAAPATYHLAVLNPNNNYNLETLELPAHGLKGIGGIALPGVPTPVTAETTTGNVTFATGKTGDGFSIVSTPNTVTFNVPDASATAGGIITTLPQTINGTKTIDDTLNIGGSAVSTSKLNLNGSMSVPFKVAPIGTYTLDANDYMVIVKCATSGDGSAADPVTDIFLPDATTVKNRIYHIRRVERVAGEFAIIAIKATGGGLISGRAAIEIGEPNSTVTVISDGTVWHAVARSIM